MGTLIRTGVVAAAAVGLAWVPARAQESVDAKVFQVLLQATTESDSTVAFPAWNENTVIHYDASPILTLEHIEEFHVQELDGIRKAFLSARLSLEGLRELEYRTANVRGQHMSIVVDGVVQWSTVLKKQYRSSVPLLPIAYAPVTRSEAEAKADELNESIQRLKLVQDDA